MFNQHSGHRFVTKLCVIEIEISIDKRLRYHVLTVYTILRISVNLVYVVSVYAVYQWVDAVANTVNPESVSVFSKLY